MDTICWEKSVSVRENFRFWAVFFQKFDKKNRETYQLGARISSTFTATETLFRPKLYFDFSTNKKSRFSKTSKYSGRT